MSRVINGERMLRLSPQSGITLDAAPQSAATLGCAQNAKLADKVVTPDGFRLTRILTEAYASTALRK